MADTMPIFTQPERDALLNYRARLRGSTAAQAGATIGNAGRTLQGKDPLYSYQEPGADNLTAQQRAQAKIALAEVLAKLAEAERAAQSSDQDYQSKKAIVSGDILKALIQLDGTKDASAKELAGRKVDAYAELQQDSINRERAAREALTLSPEGMALVQDAQSQVQGSGVLNAQALLQKVDQDLGILSKTNAAQIPAYVERLEASLRATGRPEFQDFSLAASLGNLGGQQTDPTLLRSLSGKLQTGYDAGLKAGTASEEAALQRDQAAENLKRAGGSADPILQKLVGEVSTMLIDEPTRDMSAQVQAPPPTASLDEKRAYVQRASDGKADVSPEGKVIPTQPGTQLDLDKVSGNAVSYEGFTRAYPAVRTTGEPVGQGGMALTGQSYARSGPTADTIVAIQALRANVQKQMEDLDKTALSPLAQSRAQAEEASAGFGGYSDPRFALEAAQRTAAAETRGLRREDRATRDQRVLGGEEAAPLTEKAGAVVRQGVRAAGAGLGALGQRLFQGKPPEVATPDFSPTAPEAAPAAPITDEQRQAAGTLWESARAAKTAEEALPYINEFLKLVPEPSAYREAASILRERGWETRADSMDQEADDLEFAASEKARAGQPDDTLDTRLVKPRTPTPQQEATAQEALETDVGRMPILEPWEPKVPGRKDRTAQAGVNYTDALVPGSTLGEKTGRGPLGMFSMGDLGTQASKTQTGASPNPEVPLVQPEAPRPQPAQPAPTVEGLGSEIQEPAGGGAALQSFGKGLQKEEGEQPATPSVPLEMQDARYWQQFQSQLPREQPPLDAQIQTASTATNVMDMPNFEVPDATLLLKRKQMGLVNGAMQ